MLEVHGKGLSFILLQLEIGTSQYLCNVLVIVIISGPTAATLLFIVIFYVSPLRLVFKAYSQRKLKVRCKFAFGCYPNTLNSYVSMFL